MGEIPVGLVVLRPLQHTNGNIAAFAEQEPLAAINREELYSWHPHTAIHSEELAILSAMVAFQGGYSERLTRKFMYSALLHDAGKVSLAKHNTGLFDRELEDGDWKKISRHPEIGFYRLAYFPDPVVPIVAYKHHSVQGMRSYPDGPLNFRDPKSNTFVPDFERPNDSDSWFVESQEKRRIHDRMGVALQDSRTVEEVILIGQWVAALDAAQATWVGESPWGPREYLKEHLEGLDREQIAEKQSELWGKVAADYSGDPKIMAVAMETVTQRYMSVDSSGISIN